MGYVLDPRRSTKREVRRVAAERLTDAIERLDAVIDGEQGIDVETTIHEVRKRCKESRGLARLVRGALGDEFRPFDQLVRGAANQLSATRDAHAVLATFDRLIDAHPTDVDELFRSVRDRQAEMSREATAAIEDGDDRILVARDLLVTARDCSDEWTVRNGFARLGDGLEATYGLGRRWHRTLERRATNERIHEWRKAVKYLWYQTRLLTDAAPSVMEPLVDRLDALAEALGDDHDLAVLVGLLDAEPERFGPSEAVAQARQIATAQQAALRVGALRAGSTIYVESASAFERRVERYWRCAAAEGPERPVGGIATLAAIAAEETVGEAATGTATIERERKFLVDAVPGDLDLSDRVEIRQGYLIADDSASVRVRDAAEKGCTLTVKAGQGAERTELEFAIDREHFDAAWQHTQGRRIVKTRHRIPFGIHLIELDVFADELEGLVFAEVEFDSADALAAFEPPPWFGQEVTDDGRYTNASLALRGRPAQ
jgi:CYTH domain-containing protein/CHAD domain-containing protein